MYITFYNKNKKYGALSLNGGSKTIVQSSIALRELGHSVDIVTNKDSFTWIMHPPIKHKVNPKTDVIIAVSISDVSEIMSKFPNKKLVYWSRPFEIHSESQKWQMSESKAMNLLFKFHRKNGIIMVNGGWLHKWLNMHGINNHLVYSGQDIETEFKKPDYDPNDGFRLTIGCQYSSKPRKGWKEFKKIANILGSDYEYIAFGSEKCPDAKNKNSFLDGYLRNPSRNRLNEFYRSMDVFVCCSSLEGFYNPGVEATINGCLLWVNDNPRNGAMDYANSQTACMYSTYDWSFEAPALELFSKVEKCQKLIQEKIGTRTKCMERLVECLK